MQELISDLPSKLKDRASWLINAGVDDTRQGVSAMTGTDDDMRVLRAAIETEKKGQSRTSRLDIMQGKLRKFSEAARNSLIQSRQKTAQDVEIVSDADVTQADLRATAERINQSIELIKGHQDAFEDATLEHRLAIGLEIAKAKEVFGLSIQDAGKLGGRPQGETVSRRDTVSTPPTVLKANPIGFSNWIKKEIPDLKRTTALKYETAFNALGLSTEDASPAKIVAKLKKLRHEAGKASLPMPTLGALYKQGKPAGKRDEPAINIEAPKDSKQLRLEDAREAFHVWKEQFEKMVTAGQLDDLDKAGLEDLKEFIATARDRITKRLK